jgi:ATP-dependent Clp protease ATP-binding subunit ClpA
MNSKYFEHFSAELKEILVEAQKMAKDLGSPITSSHLLLALINLSKGRVAEILRTYQVSGDKIHLALSLSKLEGKGDHHKALTKVAVKILSSALTLAKQMKQTEVKALHLLLSILDHPESGAYKILSELAIDQSDLRADLENYYSPRPQDTSDRFASQLADFQRLFDRDQYGSDFDQEMADLPFNSPRSLVGRSRFNVLFKF